MLKCSNSNVPSWERRRMQNLISNLILMKVSQQHELKSLLRRNRIFPQFLTIHAKLTRDKKCAKNRFVVYFENPQQMEIVKRATWNLKTAKVEQNRRHSIEIALWNWNKTLSGSKSIYNVVISHSQSGVVVSSVSRRYIGNLSSNGCRPASSSRRTQKGN